MIENLIDAIKSNDLTEVQNILSTRQNKIDKAKEENWSAWEKMSNMISDSEININKVDVWGRTPLHTACMRSSPEIIKELLKVDGIDANKTDYEDWTPLNIACIESNPEFVKVLLDDDRVDINKADNKGCTPLHTACGKGNTEIVKMLLDNEKIDVNKMDSKGRTPLYAACREIDVNWPYYLHLPKHRIENNTEIIKILLNDKRVDVNQANSEYEEVTITGDNAAGE